MYSDDYYSSVIDFILDYSLSEYCNITGEIANSIPEGIRRRIFAGIFSGIPEENLVGTPGGILQVISRKISVRIGREIPEKTPDGRTENFL